MPTTVDQVVTQLLRSALLGNRREPLDRLNGAVGSTTTESLTVEFSNPLIRAGSYIEVGYELMYVFGGTLPSVSVMRGQRGTTATTHADDAIVTVDPRWPKQSVLEALKAEVDGLPRDVYRVSTVDLPFPASTAVVNLPTPTGTPTRILAAHRLVGDAITSVTVNCKLITRQSTSDFASGYAVQLVGPMAYPDDVILRVAYGSTFDVSTFASSTDLEATVGLSRTLIEAVKAGTLWRLMYGSEVERTQMQATGNAMAGQYVQPTHRMQAADHLLRTRDRLIAEERRRLVDEFGMGSGL